MYFRRTLWSAPLIQCCMFATVLWHATGTTQSVSQLCTKVDRDSDGFPINLTFLPDSAVVHVCEPRDMQTPGVLFIEGFAKPSEVELLRTVGIAQFPKDADGYPYPGDKGYGMKFMDMLEDGNFPVNNDLEQKLLQDVNARMNAVTGVHWKHPYYQFILQNETNKVGAMASNMRVHHERNKEETKRKLDRYSPRFATVLMYLENAKSGGHTLFPTLGRSTDSKIAELRRHIEVNVLNETHRAIAKLEAQMGRLVVDAVNDHRMDFFDDEVSGILCAMCKEVLEAEEAGAEMPFFALKGAPGDAVIFWHWTGDRVSSWKDRFHGGCPALEGNKLAMQSYREASEYGWLKLVNHRTEALVVEREGAVIGTLPAVPVTPHFEVLVQDREKLHVHSADGSFSKTLSAVPASRAKVVELLPKGGKSRIAPNMNFRIPQSAASTSTAKGSTKERRRKKLQKSEL